jgi:hypothetical protein
MFIFYRKTNGEITFTLNGETYPPHLVTAEVDVLERNLPELDISCWKVVDGELEMFTIDPIKANYKSRIGLKISSIRSGFITDLVGQEMIYLRKEAEAIAYISATDPVLSDYPMIQAEVGITAPTGYEVAQIWLYMSQMWQVVASQLEAIRLTAVNAIASATTEAEIIDAFATFETSLAAFV